MTVGNSYFKDNKKFLFGPQKEEYQLQDVIEWQALSIAEYLCETKGKATPEIMQQCKILNSLANAYKVITA